MALVRLSGPDAQAIAAALCPGGPAWRPRRATLRTLALGRTHAGSLSEPALVVWMPGPRSYTGEDVVELSVHGNPLLARAVVDAAVAAGARPARPGEFTRRAVEQGRLQLVQAEAVHALISARTLEGVALAQAGLSGALDAPLRALREPLLDAAAELEARLDQPGGELETDDDHAVAAQLTGIAARARDLAATWDHARPRLQGARVALVGPVNAGKSSLFNHLVGSQRALVSPQPGTTRDGVERTILLHNTGVEVTLVDTAGERANPGPLEAGGLAIGRALAQEADLVVLVWPRTRPADPLWDTLRGRHPGALVAHTFADQPAAIAQSGLQIDNLTGEGLPALRAALAERLTGGETRAGALAVVSARQAALLREVATRSAEAAQALLGWAGPAIAAEEVYAALEQLAALAGEDVREAALDRLFARFCIGK